MIRSIEILPLLHQEFIHRYLDISQCLQLEENSVSSTQLITLLSDIDLRQAYSVNMSGSMRSMLEYSALSIVKNQSSMHNHLYINAIKRISNQDIIFKLEHWQRCKLLVDCAKSLKFQIDKSTLDNPTSLKHLISIIKTYPGSLIEIVFSIDISCHLSLLTQGIKAIFKLPIGIFFSYRQCNKNGLMFEHIKEFLPRIISHSKYPTSMYLNGCSGSIARKILGQFDNLVKLDISRCLGVDDMNSSEFVKSFVDYLPGSKIIDLNIGYNSFSQAEMLKVYGCLGKCYLKHLDLSGLGMFVCVEDFVLMAGSYLETLVVADNNLTSMDILNLSRRFNIKSITIKSMNLSGNALFGFENYVLEVCTNLELNSIIMNANTSRKLSDHSVACTILESSKWIALERIEISGHCFGFESLIRCAQSTIADISSTNNHIDSIGMSKYIETIMGDVNRIGNVYWRDFRKSGIPDNEVRNFQSECMKLNIVLLV